MLNYNDYDIEKYKVMERVLSFLASICEENKGFEITDQDVWDEAKGFIKPPNFGNILMEQTCIAIAERIKWLYNKDNENDYNLSLKFTYYINAHDSHIYINDDEIYSLEDFKQALTANGVTL